MNKKIARLASIAFLSTLALFGTLTRAELPPEVMEVLEKNVEASGGREVLGSIKSSRLVGTFSISALGMNGASEIVHVYPDKIYSAQELPGMGKIVQAFDGEKGWAQDPMQGFRYLSEGEVATLKQNESLASMLDFDAQFESGELLEDQEVEGETVNVLKLVSKASGSEETRYYSIESGLLLKVDTIADMGSMGKMPASMVIKSYGEQDGIRFPSLMEMENAGMLISIGFESLEVNPEIDDALFAAPQ